MILLLIILPLLFGVEMLTNYGRVAGYRIKNDSAGLFFQNALGLISRILMMMFLPIVSYLADTNAVNNKHISWAVFITPIILFLVSSKSKWVIGIVSVPILRISETGSYFKKASRKPEIKSIQKDDSISLEKVIFIVLFSANVIYYSGWYIILILLGQYNEFRSTVISSSGFLNGFYTISMVMFIDPKLSSLVGSDSLEPYYSLIVRAKVMASVVAAIMVLVFNFTID